MRIVKNIIIILVTTAALVPVAMAEETIFQNDNDDLYKSVEHLQRADDTRTLIPSDVKGAYKIWSITLNSGLSIMSGNTEQLMFTGDLKLNRNWSFANTYIWLKGNYLSVNGKSALNNLSGTIRGDYNIYGPLSWFIYNTHSTNEFIKLNYRMTIGSGPWVDFSLGPINNSFSLALAYEYEYLNPDITENNTRLSLRHIATCNLLENLELGADFFYVPKLNDFTDYRIYLEAFLKNKILEDKIFLNVKIIDEIDSTPQPDVKPYDLSLITSIGFNFGE